MSGKSSSASSRPIISGCPSPIGYLAELFMNMDKHLAQIIDPIILSETERIRKELPEKEAAWKDIAEDFNILWDPENLTFNYAVKGKSKAIAASLEYGPPAKSLLRHEVLQVDKTMGKAINTKVNEFLGNKK